MPTLEDENWVSQIRLLKTATCISMNGHLKETSHYLYCHIQIKVANETTYSRNKLENTTPTNNFVMYVYSIQQPSKTKNEKIAFLYPPLLYVLYFQELLKTPVECFNIS